ncbi:hypothetical protein B0H13DRAFT_1887104 [Mycena leptocephala]|nr:hypothetical protein B0H13DRAFT_1887104 [Mycena leptocephala]
MTDFYDDYLDAYADEPPPPRPRTSQPNRVQCWWTQDTPQRPHPGPAWERNCNAARNEVEHKPTKPGGGRQIHHDGDVHGMMLPLGTPFDEFMDKVTSRFGSTVMLKLVDEDGIKVSLRDRDDYELAIETPRQSYKGANSRFGALTCPITLRGIVLMAI